MYKIMHLSVTYIYTGIHKHVSKFIVLRRESVHYARMKKTYYNIIKIHGLGSG